MKITEIVSTPALEESLTGEIGKGLIGLGKKVFGKGADDAVRAAADAPKSWQQKAAGYASKKAAAKETAALNAKAFAYASEHLAPEVTKALKALLLFETVIE